MTDASPVPSPYSAALPAVLRADPALMRVVSAAEEILHRIDVDVSTLVRCFDPQQAPPGFLPWLAGWVGMSLRADWSERTQRAFIAEAMSLHRWRGTVAGLRRILEIHLDLRPGHPSLTIHDQFVDAPHFFEVAVDLAWTDRARVDHAVEIARLIIDREKPAHTYYALHIGVPAMRLVSPELRDRERAAAGLTGDQEGGPPLLQLGRNTVLGSTIPTGAGA